MSIGRIAFLALAVCLLPAMAGAAPRCGALTSDAAQLEAAQAELAAACACAPGDSSERRSFLRCVGSFVTAAAKQGSIRPECRQKLRTQATRSTCGRRAGSVACCSAQDAGAPSCRIAASADACLSSRSGQSWIGSGTSCADACGGSCRGPLDCNDGNPCTVDACSAGGCTHTAIPGCGGGGGPTNCQGTAASTWEMDDDELDVLDRMNAERSRRGIRLLRTCRSLGKAAQKHAADMRDRDYVSHWSPNGTTYVERMCKAGFALCRSGWAMGEILMAGSNRSEMAFAAWMNSPSHREIVLHPALSVVGIGHACGGRYTGYWVADFAGTSHSSCD